jgi:trk system potassium uptake protein TrkH
MPESVRARARHAIAVYGVLTVLGVAAIVVAGATPFEGLVHALAAVSTGGFSTHDGSLAALGSWPVQAVAVALGLCGAVSLPLYQRARRDGPRALVEDVELRALVVGCLVLSVLLGVAMVVESKVNVVDALRSAPLLATSAHTTTGFTPLPVADLGPTAKLLMIGSMLVGGSFGSTAGGVKLLRVLIAFRLLQWAVSRARLAPHAISEPRLAGERLSSGEIQRALVVVLLFLLVIGASWVPFVASGYDPLNSLFEVVSAAGTVGLTTGISRPELEAPLKLILCADMLLGRVEIVALLVVLAPRTWWGRRAA